LAGVVTDGGIRDREGIKRVGLPVFAQDVQSPQGAFKDGPGEVNVPVACGGVPVLPGDIIVADANGVVVVPRADAEEVGRQALQIVEYEQNRMKEIEAGHLIPGSIHQTLREKGCLIK
jgi:regulator of RNase E activity RraA